MAVMTDGSKGSWKPDENPAALIEKTGWKPRVDLEEGISRLIAEMSP